ncbi:MAG TPA: hypothetical protein VFA56_05850 [Gaiellaceae bacterium]|nr:hypothetical protein [Gaiellaceae bacterium]
MAVVMSMRWPGITPADYDRALEVVGWEREPAEGGLDHVAWFDGNGLFHVTDVWESEAAFTKFADERLMPGLQAAGILTGKPPVEIEFATLHRHWAPELAATPA